MAMVGCVLSKRTSVACNWKRITKSTQWGKYSIYAVSGDCHIGFRFPFFYSINYGNFPKQTVVVFRLSTDMFEFETALYKLIYYNRNTRF